MNHIHTRLAQDDDLEAITGLFYDTVTSVNTKDYSPEQIKVWASSIAHNDRWMRKLSQQHFLVATQANIILGFGSMTSEGYLDFMYVHKDHQRRGVAQLLMDQLLSYASAKGNSHVQSDVSITAVPFFQKNGFKILEENHNHLNGEVLINYKMEKEFLN